ncbi:MAG: AraC family transcriptional regulator [Prevotella sp.]|nr:AraC family transcriptional regulator [Prevotella sp.]
MELDLFINQANDYAQDIGAEVYHPHVSIIHYDEVGEIRHSLNRFNVYALFLQKEFPENLTYGIGKYDHRNGSLLAYSPGQIGGKTDDGTLKQYHGWVLLFDNTFIQGSEIEKRLSGYHFFSYNSNEALFLTEEEKETLSRLMEHIRQELKEHQMNVQSDYIIKDYILLILDYCNRFYTRQFKEQSGGDSDILTRFQQLLNDYYLKGLQRQHGLPSVKYCASELFLSPGYFGDIIRNALGESPKDYIHGFVIMRAKNLLLGGKSITQVADDLGFEYPNHFTRLFKSSTGQTPSQFVAEQQKK